MANPNDILRVERRLTQASEATPKGANFWRELAEIAIDEFQHVPAVAGQPVPQPTSFQVLLRQRSGLQAIDSGHPNMNQARQAATDFLVTRGRGEVYVMEIREALSADN